METLVFERNGFLYLVGAVAPIQPTANEVDELAFADALRSSAPNDNILWMRGQYVEGDRPNGNGQTWMSEELAIKSLTPRLMPVTVMHDPSTAVGLIADTKLLEPEKDKVPRSRIDTVLAVWQHRFPTIAEECEANYQQGTLMQSMECVIGHYECLECGKGFVKLPKNAEQANWCTHLKGAADSGHAPRRLLRDVTFTGTGLILGTRRGATGALDTAHLEIAEEVAEFHERAKSANRRVTRRTSRMDTIEIPRSEYDELNAKAAKHDELAKRVTSLEEAAGRTEQLEKDVEQAEIATKKAEDERDEERGKREKLEEEARSAGFASERLGKLGSEFTTKLPERTRERLNEQAKSLSDEDWTARLEELAELVGVQPDAGSKGGEPTGTVTGEETARTQFGGSPAPATPATPSKSAVSSVIGGLARQVRPQSPDRQKK